MTSVAIGDNVTTIGDQAFEYCTHLASVAIPVTVTSIGNDAFYNCDRLASATIGNGVTNIGNDAFAVTSLASVTIPNSVTTIGSNAFYYCQSLARIYFAGNAPMAASIVFEYNTTNATVYYLPGTTGWGSTYGGLPTALWFLPTPVILNNSPGFGVQANRFGFTISWATNSSVVVEACTNLANPIWVPIQTNTLADGSSYFSDSEWTNYPRRFYRLSTP
jgi:hypothetical protein